MPRYHFHLVDGYQISDVKGMELANDDAARRHAEDLARSAFGEHHRAIRVMRDDGHELFRVDLTGQPGDRHNSK